jgi:hypothetical protein
MVERVRHIFYAKIKNQKINFDPLVELLHRHSTFPIIPIFEPGTPKLIPMSCCSIQAGGLCHCVFHVSQAEQMIISEHLMPFQPSLDFHSLPPVRTLTAV